MFLNHNFYEKGEEIFKGFIVKEIHGGSDRSGFGVVYITYHEKSGEYLAIKTLQNEEFTQKDFETFQKEINPWILFFRHPFIVEAYGLEFDDNKRPILIMEPVLKDENGNIDLCDFIKTPLKEQQILKWSIQFCYAMDFINNKGYIHGDIKPDNILIKNSNIKVSDFGLTEPLDSDEKNKLSPIQYKAPELWEVKSNGKNIKTEIYSFGMVMYQMLNLGKFPTDAYLIDDWEEFHKKGEIPRLNSDLFHIIEKCLEKDPSKRFNSFYELNNKLSEILWDKYGQTIEEPNDELIDNLGDGFRGRLYAKLGDIKNCKKYYHKLLKKYPHNIFIHSYVLDLIHLKEFDEALKFLNELVKNPHDLELETLYMNMGHCYYEKEQLGNSFIYYTKAIKETDNLTAHLNVGNIYKKYGLFNQAFEEFNYVLDKYEKNERALLYIGELHKIQGNYNESEKYLEKLTYTRHNLETRYKLGLFYKDTNLMKFLDVMSNVENQYYFRNRVLYNRFKFHLENKNPSEANIIFNEICENSDDLELPLILCRVYDEYGYPNEAIEKIEYLESIADEEFINNIIYEKSFIVETDDINEAIRLNELLLTRNISDEIKSNVYANLGDIYFRMGKDYVSYYSKALEYNYKNMHAQIKLIAYHIINENYDQAEEYIKKGLSIDSENFKILYLKAYLYQLKEEYEQARNILFECLKLKPTIEIYRHLSHCYLKLDNEHLAAHFHILSSNMKLIDDYNKTLTHQTKHD